MYRNLQNLLLSNEFTVSEYKGISYGLQFSVQKSGWSGIVRIYQNKQGKVKTDLSQLDESDHADLIKSFLHDQNDPPSQTAKSALPSNVELPVIGSDESGKGDYFGSLVTACVYVDENTANQLAALGVKDSKTLSDSRISEIARSIRRICEDKFVVVEISSERYNQLYKKLENQNSSLNDLLAWAHAKAIEELLLKVECQTAIVDQFADEKILHRKLQEKGKKLNVIQTYRAESHIAVAAASILARDRFINKLSRMEKEYQMKLPKGASKEVVAAARQLVARSGREILEKVAKTHFKTTKEVLEDGDHS
ncbi:ribonuclease HIII [Pseudanabaenaceae cyanobacterium LEGE 13415]|nr:ribonuclease HIII [Pseudanabaenaceae cyanobacterium LEGE 13415]